MVSTEELRMASLSFKKIEHLEDGQKKINLMGVVTSFRPPSKSRGRDYSCSMSLVDEGGQSVKCLLFNPSEDDLPQDCSSGDVICLHRVNVNDFNDRLQVQGAKFSSWMLFKLGGIGAIPVTSSTTMSYTLTQSDRTRVKELKRWSLQNNIASGFSPNVTPFTAAPQSSIPSASAQNGIATIHTASSSSSSTPSTSATASSLANPDRVFKPKSSRFYDIQIRTLNQLIPDSHTKVGVCGVVKYFKAPSASKGKDYYTVIGIVDESSPQRSLECVVFNPHQERLPVVCSVGEVVLIKGITISNFNNVLTGSGHEHTLVGIFSEDPSTLPSNSIGTWYGLRSNELSRIKSLKQWAFGQGDRNTKFEEVTRLHCFNTICRIASIATNHQLGIQVLGVYDGTTLKLPSSEIVSTSSKHQWKVDHDPNACYMYQGLIYDVHVSKIKNLRVGDSVELVNVVSLPVNPNHAAVADSSDQPQIELKLCTKKSDVQVLPGDSPSVLQFLNNMPRPYGPFPMQRSPSNVPKTIGTVLHKPVKQTATLKQIQDSPIGSGLCCEVEVLGVEPTLVEDFCQLRCSDCKMRYVLPKLEDIETEDSGYLTVGDPCINCNDSEENTSTLKYMYMFILHIRDNTGELRVFVSDKEGATLLQDLPPTNLHVDSDSRQKLLDILYRLTGGNDPFYPLPHDLKYSYPRPLLKCCLLSYKSQTEQQHYSLIDTVLSN